MFQKYRILLQKRKELFAVTKLSFMESFMLLSFIPDVKKLVISSFFKSLYSCDGWTCPNACSSRIQFPKFIHVHDIHMSNLMHKIIFNWKTQDALKGLWKIILLVCPYLLVFEKTLGYKWERNQKSMSFKRHFQCFYFFYVPQKN